jgi:hypothetical protein
MQPPQALADGASQGPELSAEKRSDASTYRLLVDTAPYHEALLVQSVFVRILDIIPPLMTFSTHRFVFA